MIQLSHSRVKLWRKCRRAHWYRYVMDIERRRKARPLFIGSVGHECLAQLTGRHSVAPVVDGYRAKLKRELFVEERSEYEEMIDDALRMVRGYRNRWKNDGYRYPKFNGRTCEHPINLVATCPTTGLRVKVKGFMDALPRDEKGRLWLMEHKFMARVPPEELRMWDVQTVLYGTWLKQAGYPKVSGVVWDYIRTRAPHIPTPLKNGKLSTRKNMDTTEAVYREAITRHNLDPADYESYIQEKLRGKESSYYRRIVVPFSSELTRQVEDDFWQTANEISRQHMTSNARTMERHCGWCDYQDICYAELRGTDTERLLKREYRKRGQTIGKEKDIEVSR